jgi:TPR repeat protein
MNTSAVRVSPFDSSGDLLEKMAASSAGGAGGMSAGQYYALTPAARQYYTPQTVTTHLLLRNAPAEGQLGKQNGSFVGLFAMPLSDGTVDYGTPYNGSLAGMTILRVTEKGLVKVQIQSEQEIEDKKAALEQKVFALHKKEAEEGDKDSQFDLGQRYLNGNGVSQDRELAIHWFQAAATNGSERSKLMLSTLTNTPSADTNTPSPGAAKSK